MRKGERDEARSIANHRLITIGTCYAIVISTRWQTTETFPTPGDTIVLNVTQRQEMSFQRLISSYESPRSRHFPVNFCPHLMYSRDERLFLNTNDKEICLNDTTFPTSLKKKSRQRCIGRCKRDICQLSYEWIRKINERFSWKYIE